MDLSTLILKLKKSTNDKTFRILFETFYPQAYQTAYLISRDEHLAKDATQEAFIKAFSSLHQLREPEKFRTWLMSIVSNQTIDILKKHKKLLPVEDMEKVIPLTGHKYSEASPIEEMFGQQETKKFLLGQVSALPLCYRQVVVLKYFCDFKDREIAGELGIKEGTVKSRLNRARLILKRKITSVKEAEFPGDMKGGARV